MTVSLAWEELKGLLFHPSEALEGVLARRGFVLSLALGTIGYYGSTLQISEIILPASLGGRAYFLLNFGLGLMRMALIVFLVHLASRMVVGRKGGWGDLLSLWGYTQLPAVILTALGVAFFATAPTPRGLEVGIPWLLLIVGIVLFLSLWSLILKLQAIRVCYDVRGRQLLAVIALALLLYGTFASLETIFLDEDGLVPDKAVHAMEPTPSPLILGWHNLSLPFDTLTYHLRSPKRGEVVGVLPPGLEGLFPFKPGFRVRYIGRIVGRPGEKVEVRDGRLFIDDRLLNEPYLVGPLVLDVSPTRVPPGHFFILGDNRGVPVEAYRGGLVPVKRIRGRLTDVGRMKWQILVGKWRR